jgi:hypothetical protein
MAAAKAPRRVTATFQATIDVAGGLGGNAYGFSPVLSEWVEWPGPCPCDDFVKEYDAQLALLAVHLGGSDRASFRLDGKAGFPYGRHIWGYDGRPDAGAPVLRITYYVP